MSKLRKIMLDADGEPMYQCTGCKIHFYAPMYSPMASGLDGLAARCKACAAKAARAYRERTQTAEQRISGAGIGYAQRRAGTWNTRAARIFSDRVLKEE